MLDIDIEQINSPSGRTFQPDRNDKSGRTALRVANAPAGATYRWTTQPEAVQFIAPNAPATSILAGVVFQDHSARVVQKHAATPAVSSRVNTVTHKLPYPRKPR